MTGHRPQDWAPTGDVSPTCEVLEGNSVCGAASSHAYPAKGGGYMSLCPEHAQKHLRICVTIDAARRGEVPDLNAPWEDR